MKIIKGNLFDQKCDAICITTNGYFTYKGDAVMGRGVAAEAVKKWSWIKKKLGYMLQMHGTHVFIVLKRSKKNGRRYHVVNFPVKPKGGKSKIKNVVKRLQRNFPEGRWVPGWALKAKLELIEQSAREIVELADDRGWKRVVIPKPGCGAGELKWETVREAIRPIFKGSRFVIIDHLEGNNVEER